MGKYDCRLLDVHHTVRLGPMACRRELRLKICNLALGHRTSIRTIVRSFAEDHPTMFQPGYYPGQIPTIHAYALAFYLQHTSNTSSALLPGIGIGMAKYHVTPQTLHDHCEN